MLEKESITSPEGIRKKITAAYHMDESTCVKNLIDYGEIKEEQYKKSREKACEFIEEIRKERKKSAGIDSFLTEYSLSSEEGIALMCLAEAYLRVPDNQTIDSLIKDKLARGNWQSHQGKSHSFFVNATTWALMLTGKILAPEQAENRLIKALMKLVNRSSEGVIRHAVEKAMRIMSKQFVMGRNIKEAVSRARDKEKKGYLYSYDMLGEAALTAEDAARYFAAYTNALHEIGKSSNEKNHLYRKPGISVKLSALHPRYFESQHERVLVELTPRLLQLAQLAKQYKVSLTVDAEECERLDLSLDIMKQVFSDPSLNDWQGFGLALQSYQKRAFYVLDWIADLARKQKKRFMVRLIKGAYWDSEIKNAQMLGLKDYPVFTLKAFTDVSFQACAKKILTLTDVIYPQFATHNAYSVAMIMQMAGSYRDFEFQCLHGMGAELYDQIVPEDRYNIPCRIYAPVGSHEDLLPYLVRRLLENGANSSFVNRIVDEKAPLSSLVENPVEKAKQLLPLINENIPLPINIFKPIRTNSKGIDFTDRQERALLQEQLSQFENRQWNSTPILANKELQLSNQVVYSPQNYPQSIGMVSNATIEDAQYALDQAEHGFQYWSKQSVEHRAQVIEHFSDLLEENKAELMTLACLEAGKTWNDGIAEVREAVDFCRYYATCARELMSEPKQLTGYTGETNELSHHPRGIIVCISPWNFPLAIFTGQIVAALVTGNAVLAKPAEQTPLIAGLVVKLMYKAGIPENVLQLLPGSGEKIGGALIADQRVKGVMFTGSTTTANHINNVLAGRGGAIVPLIAETGGQNAMIVDSSALLEQVVEDVLISAFGSAGQRCSALRVLYVQEDIYSRFLELLEGAMAELKVGDPQWYDTDVGPVIDKEALENLKAHVKRMQEKHDILYQSELSEECHSGFFMPPTAIAIDSIMALEKEVFGPVLHVISYKRKDLDHIIQEINKTQYGLTLGIHSRVNHTAEYIRQRARVGNCYVNRNMTGAIVGLQPFGGEGLSGTGPKAGGPYYLHRLCHERVYTVDTTAAGGNASLMSLSEDL